MLDVLLGLQWGDEGKGKIVDVFAPNYDIIARFQGGPNAGHTLEFDNKKIILHTIPSGIFREKVVNLIGNGVVIDPLIFFKEIKEVEAYCQPRKNLIISSKAHLILPSHRLLDAAYEKKKASSKIGSTLKGIGPTYTDKYARIGLRVGDVLTAKFVDKYQALKEAHLEIMHSMQFEIEDFLIEKMSFTEYEKQWLHDVQRLKEFQIEETEYYINEALNASKKVLAEGAQGSLLDVDFGSYPFVTSSNTISAAVCNGLGIAPTKINKIFGVFKAYCTRVGSGPFPTELDDENGEMLRKTGHEFGSTTGRPRRCGWLDIPALNYAVMLSGVTDLIITKVDVFDELKSIKVCTNYIINRNKTDKIPFNMDEFDIGTDFERMDVWNKNLAEHLENESDFPKELENFLSVIETHTKTPICFISYGPNRKQIITR
jgi:adenylosuccinate synthase